MTYSGEHELKVICTAVQFRKKMSLTNQNGVK